MTDAKQQMMNLETVTPNYLHLQNSIICGTGQITVTGNTGNLHSGAVRLGFRPEHRSQYM
jgi:hypothetical protein